MSDPEALGLAVPPISMTHRPYLAGETYLTEGGGMPDGATGDGRGESERYREVGGGLPHPHPSGHAHVHLVASERERCMAFEDREELMHAGDIDTTDAATRLWVR